MSRTTHPFEETAKIRSAPRFRNSGFPLDLRQAAWIGNAIIIDEGPAQPSIQFKGEQCAKSVSVSAGRTCDQEWHCFFTITHAARITVALTAGRVQNSFSNRVLMVAVKIAQRQPRAGATVVRITSMTWAL